MSTLFEQIARETPDYLKRFVDLSFDIADALHAQVEARGISPQALAVSMDVPEALVHAWLSGTHDFSLKTLCHLAEQLGHDFFAYTYKCPPHP